MLLCIYVLRITHHRHHQIRHHLQERTWAPQHWKHQDEFQAKLKPFQVISSVMCAEQVRKGGGDHSEDELSNGIVIRNMMEDKQNQ